MTLLTARPSRPAWLGVADFSALSVGCLSRRETEDLVTQPSRTALEPQPGLRRWWRAPTSLMPLSYATLDDLIGAGVIYVGRRIMVARSSSNTGSSRKPA
jgi:hypothetical protein